MKRFITFLEIAFALIFFLGIATFAYTAYNNAKTISGSAVNKSNKLSNEMLEEDKLIYDGADQNGMEVINVIRKFEGESIGIIVKNGGGNVTYYGYNITVDANGIASLGSVSSAELKNAKDVTSATYINPNALFEGKVHRNKNDAIIAVEFIQK